MNLSVIIPTYNEEENLKILLPELHRIIAGLNITYELLVVDAKTSQDRAEETCSVFNAKYFRQVNSGYADAIRIGIEKSGCGLVLVVDADNSQDISKIPDMYDAIINGADVAIGSRYTKGGKTDDPPISVLMSKLLNGTYRLLLGFKEKDVSTDFRIYRKHLLTEIKTTCTNFDMIEETLFLLKRKFSDLNVVEIPIHYRQRVEGISKRQLLKFIQGYIRLLFRLLKLRLSKKG